MNLTTSRFNTIIHQFDDNLLVIPNRQQVLRTDIRFIDNTRLVAFEYTYFDTSRTKYSYQWMNPDNSLIMRWDNANHHPEITTHPDHKHVGSDVNVLPSEPMTFEKVLTAIATTLLL